MTSRPCFCGIDVGTQGVRVSIVDLQGTGIASAAHSLPRSSKADGRHEQRPQDWWSALVEATRQATAALADGWEVQALALDATSGTVLLEDEDGAPRGPALMYDDSRASEQATRAQRLGGDLWDQLGYRMQPSWGLPKAMWLSESASPAPGDRVVHQSDHLVRRLTGHPVATDTSNALKTGADLRSVRWPTELLADLGLPTRLLPELVVPGTELGRVTEESARLTGLPAGTPLRAGMTDGCAAQIAAGALRSGSWSSALGTTLVVKGATDTLVRDPHGAVYSHRHPDGGWLPGGASSTGAGALRDFLAVDADLDELTRLAAERAHDLPAAAASYPLVGTGERFPFVAPQARGFLAEADDEVERFAAICLGIAYVERLAYDVLGELGADVSGTVALTGGASSNDWWNQLRTDVLGRVTTRPTSADAATGMAILAAAEPGSLTGTAERMVVVAERREPDRARGQQLDEGYRRLLAELADRGWLDADLATSVSTREGVSR